jgi:hypothetical protein
MQVAKGRGWTELALDGDTAWLLAREGSKGSLLRTALSPGSAPSVERPGLEQPVGLWAGGGRLAWVEMQPAVSPGLEFVPSTGAVARVFLRETSGQTRPVGEWPVGEAPAKQAPASVLGFLGPDLCLQVTRLVTTEFVRFPLAGGAPTRLAAEAGARQGLIREGVLYWTAPSEEATPTSSLACLRRLQDGKPVLQSEWLVPGGQLASIPEGLFYGVPAGLYRLPAGAELPEPVAYLAPGALTSDGRSLVLRPVTGAPVLVSTKGAR